uniref:Uncharacterized protein n=1 Tax=Brassica campestris TaxID=3711 RepID=A0A3P5ZFZ1_BRACM|nr:unnamed protein product [Brassica rapa]
MILCYCNGIRTRTFDISLNDQHFLLSMKMIFYFDVVADVESGGIVAEEELQLLNKPNHVSTPEEAENQCGKAGCGQVLHEPFLKVITLSLEYYDPKPGEFVVGVVTCDKEFDYLLCDLKYVAEEFLVHVCKARHACGGDRTMIFADVLGRTLSGRHLLSSRRYFRRIAWHQDGSMIRQNVIRLKSFRDHRNCFQN